MSAAATRRREAGTVPLARALRAEVTRARGSASARFALVGLAICVLQGVSWRTVATQAMPDWFGLLGWQSAYVTGLLAPIMALLASATVAREAAAREGGTWARPLSARTARVARLLVLTGQSVLLQAALSLPMLAFGLAGGLADPPVGRFLLLWLVLTTTSLLPLVLAFALAGRLGTVATVGLAFVWQLAGTLTAESPLWWAQPWTWAVHAALPVLGIHQNAIRLEPGSPVWSWNPLVPAAMSVILALALAALAARRARVVIEPRRGFLARWRGRLRHAERESEDVATAARRGISAAPAAGVVRRAAPRPVRTQLLALRSTAIPALVLAALVVTALVGLVWDSSFVMGFSTWALVPFGSCILACLLWAANASAWRVVALRQDPVGYAASVLTICLTVLALVVAAASLAAVAGGGPAVPIAFPVLSFAVGAAVVVVSLWIATRFGTGAAIGLTLVTLVFSVVFGSTWMAATRMWFVGVLGWPLTAADDPVRTGIALAASVAVSAGAALAWVRALRRAAR